MGRGRRLWGIWGDWEVLGGGGHRGDWGIWRGSGVLERGGCGGIWGRAGGLWGCLGLWGFLGVPHAMGCPHGAGCCPQVLLFLFFSFAGLYLTLHVTVGLDQEIAMPEVTPGGQRHVVTTGCLGTGTRGDGMAACTAPCGDSTGRAWPCMGRAQPNVGLCRRSMAKGTPSPGLGTPGDTKPLFGDAGRAGRPHPR